MLVRVIRDKEKDAGNVNMELLGSRINQDSETIFF